jgi:hypothetical protein
MWWGFKRALLFEIMCAVLIALIGFGGLDPPWYRIALLATQVPAMFVLGLVGLCCGWANGLLIGDVFYNRWGGLTPIGAPVIFVANVLVVGAILGFGHYRRTVRRRVVASPPDFPAS